MPDDQETKAQKALRQSEDLLRAFMDSAPCAFAAFDPELNLVAINKLGLQMLPPGTRREDVIGKNLRHFTAGFENGEGLSMFLEVMRTGKPISIDDVEAGPRYGNARFAVNAFKVSGGLGIMATDITDRKKTEQEARESQVLVHGILDNTDSLIVVRDIQGRYLLVNKQVEDVLGVKSKDIIGKTPLDIHSKDQANKILADDKRVIDSGRLLAIEDELDVQGQTRTFLGSRFPLLDAAGVPHAVCTVVTDITDRRGAEQALQESERKLRSIIHHSNEVFFIHDTQDRLTYVSPQSEDVLGYTPDEMMVKWTTLITDNPINEKAFLLTRKALETGEKQEPYILEARTKDGNTRFVEIDESPIKDEAGNVVGITGALRDVTDRKRAEETILAERNKLKSIAGTIQCGLAIRDLEYNLTYQNNYLTRIFGEHLGEKCYRVFEGNEEVCEGCPVALSFKDGKSHTAVRRVVMPSGEISYWENVASPIKDVEGNIISCLEVNNNITDRKMAQEALEASEEEFRIITEHSFDAVMMADLDGTLTYASPSVLRVFGYRPDEMVGMNVAQVVCESDMPKVIQEFKDIAAGESFERQEVRIIRKDGSIGVIELNSGPVLRDGEIVGAQASARDITERKEAEDALKESEEKFRRITEHSFNAVLAADLNGILTYASPSVIRVLGYTPDEMIGKGPADFMPESSVERVKQVLSGIVGGKSSPVAIEVDVWKKDGALAKMELNSVPVRKGGEIIGVQASLRDITDRKRAEEALRESEERYRTVVENAGETIAMISREGVFQFMNKTGAERLGGKPENYIGKKMCEVFPKEIADRQMGSVRSVINSGKGMNFIAPTLLRGQTRWYNTTIEPLRGGGGEVTAVLIIARDIHEIRQAEVELEAYGEKIDRAERLASLGTLSATLSHELTQPLTVIALSIEDALTELEGISCPKVVTEGLHDSLSEVANVTTIIDRFRNFARKSSGLAVDNVQLSVIGEKIVKLLSKSAQQAAVTVRLKDMDKLPTIHSNEKELEQLFFALIQNGIQAADGKKPHNLVVEGVVKDEYIELRFSDDCGGIEQADVDNVFEPFFTTKALGEGTGLGLCIVQRVAERAGGEVTVENRPGEGVTFVVTLSISENRMS